MIKKIKFFNDTSLFNEKLCVNLLKTFELVIAIRI